MHKFLIGCGTIAVAAAGIIAGSEVATIKHVYLAACWIVISVWLLLED